MQASSKLKIPAMIIATIGALAMIAAFFLPFYSIADEYKSALLTEPETFGFDQLGLYGSDALEMSPYKAAKGIIFADGESLGSFLIGAAVDLVVIFGALVLTGGCTGSGIVAAIFSLLGGGGIVAGDIILHTLLKNFIAYTSFPFTRSYGFFVYAGGAALGLIGAVLLIVAKRKAKKPPVAANQPAPFEGWQGA